jgi:adenylate cyclase
MRYDESIGKAPWASWAPFLGPRFLAAQYDPKLNPVMAASLEYDEARRCLDELKELPPSESERRRRQDAASAAVTRLKALSLLFGRVRLDSLAEIKKSLALQEAFLSGRSSETVVMAVDIRRSTELMLKARDAGAFAEFIGQLSEMLLGAVTEHYGVIDKFTGDGILAYFPKFFAGEDAVRLAMATAQRCHAAFRDHYFSSRDKFRAVLADVGLGIGIDSGPVHIMEIGGNLTVVGTPVVYACRLASCRGGTTVLNQAAIDEYGETVDVDDGGWTFEEQELEIKHEGRLIVYEATATSAVAKWRDPQETWDELDASFAEGHPGATTANSDGGNQA